MPISGYGHTPDRYERADRDFAVADQRCDGIGQVFNFCTGEKLAVRALAEKVRDMTGFRGQILWDTIPRRPLDIQMLYGDASKAKSVLGWQFKISLDEGLRRTIDFWRKKLAGSERATRATSS